MGRPRVDVPEVTRLILSDGDYIDVKKDLNAGDYFDLLTDLQARRKFSKILAYVLGWSFVDHRQEPIPYSIADDEQTRRDTIGSLDKGTLRELIAALDRHEAAVELAKKKATPTPSTAGAPASSPTSTSAAS